jgi:hypothetical protein
MRKQIARAVVARDLESGVEEGGCGQRWDLKASTEVVPGNEKAARYDRAHGHKHVEAVYPVAREAEAEAR